jgi:hypothetical protein
METDQVCDADGIEHRNADGSSSTLGSKLRTASDLISNQKLTFRSVLTLCNSTPSVMTCRLAAACPLSAFFINPYSGTAGR